MTAALRVIEPGFRTTVQDLGRPGFQRYGVPVSGALDATAFRAANLLVGNAPSAAALEITLTGPLIEIEAEGVRLGAAGAGLELERVGHGVAHSVASGTTVTLVRGDRLRVIGPRHSAVGYLSIAGGLDVTPVLGSCSTSERAGIGGRGLKAGDRLPLASALPPSGLDRRGPALDLTRPRRLRVIPSPPDRDFTAAAIACFLRAGYTVAAASDRMGLRLSGPAIGTLGVGESLSEGTTPGAIQIPGDGRPILLLADRQTTGGYPRVAHVISADLPAAGRLRPGDIVSFEAVDLAAADAARASLAANLARFAAGIVAVSPDPASQASALAEQNLVSGVISGREDG